ncbi:MAG: ethanolamine utilization protein EutH [Clostridium sp.]|nr:ethanolamine utilization protein EutH [Clostridium sp.]
MSFNKMNMRMIAMGLLAGAAHKITGGHLGLGKKFDEGVSAMGPPALGMEKTERVCREVDG